MANLCGPLEDVFLGCDENTGGIQKIWLFDMADVTVNEKDDETHEYTSLNIGAAPKVFELVVNSANYTDELTTEAVNQAIQWTQTLSIQKNVRNAKHSKVFRQYTKGLRYLGILILDQNGEYMIMENAQLTGVTDGSGTVGTDGSKYLATFTATNRTSMFFLDKEKAADFIATGIYSADGSL